jgi:hypothetical protein
MDESKKDFNLKIVASEEHYLQVIGYLKSNKHHQGSVKHQIMRAMMSFFDPYSIGEDPNSSKEDVLESVINSLNTLSGQMSDLAAYVQVRHGIDPDIWKRFGLLPTSIAPTYDRPQSIANALGESTGDRLSRDNQQRFSRGEATPTEEIDRELASREIAPVVQTAQKKPPAAVELEDEDDDDDLSDEEYEAKMRASIPTNSFKFAD